ncbi:MAG: glycosyltransferase family 39 protein [Anaerolineales bacterium]|nr:glycosyltransferase family 39 protein [Anaerolineales bacterium]
MKQAKLLQAGLLILVIGIYAGLAWFNSINIPLSKAPDEYVHFRYIRFIVENGRLPQTNTERQTTGYKADQPPLYYGLVALVTSWIKTDGPPILKMTWDSPRRKLVDLVLPRAMVVRTEDETWPYAGIVLAWMAGRWLSILMGAVTIVLVYLVALEIFPGQPNLALAAAATFAFIPCFTYISAVLSDENLLGVVLGLYFWGLVRFSKGQRGIRTFMALGLLMGLAVITKYSAVVLPLEFLLVLAVLARRQPWPWRRRARDLAAMALAGVIASGGWFLFQAWYFNRVEEFGPVAGIIRPLIAGDESLPGVGMLAGILTGTASEADHFEAETQGSLWTWVSAFFTKFWVVEIVGAQPPFPPLFTVSLMLGVVLIAGVGWWLIWRRNQGQERDWLGLLLLHLFIFVPIPLLRFLLSGRINDTAQARYLVFSAAPAVGLLLAWGIAVAAGERYRRGALLGLVGVMAALSGVSTYHFWTGFPAPLPVRTAAMLPVQPKQPPSIRFNDGFELTGYDQQISGDGSTLQVTLYWRSLAYAHEDYETHLSLLDNGGQVVAETAAQPAQGRYPVRAWDPGDSLHDQIFLPLAGVAAGSYQLQLRLIGWQRPLAAGSTDTFILGQVDVPGYRPPKPSHTLTSAQDHLFGFDLWQAGQIAPGQPVYRYRAAIPITVSYQDVAAEAEVRVWLVGPDQRRREPVTGVNQLQTFIVDYDWPSGPYDLEVELWQGNQPLDQGYSKAVLLVENQPPRFEPPNMTYRIGANFGNQIELLGYDLPQRRVVAGQGVPLVLYWRGLTRMREDYTIFVQLLDAGQQRRGGYDRYPRENYNTYLWLPGEVIDDGFAVPVEADAPDGVYTIRVGLYQKDRGRAVTLPLVREGQAQAETSVAIGPVKVGGPPPEMVLSSQTLSPQYEVGAILGEPPAISLRGYDLTRQADGLHLTLYWESLSQTPVDWSVFVHLRNGTGQIVAQKDGPAATNGSLVYPTSLWDTGEIVVNKIVIPLLDELPAGEYHLIAGLYNLADGMRLSIPGSPNHEITLTRWRPAQP